MSAEGSRRENEGNSCTFNEKSDTWCFGRCFDDGCFTEQQCDNGYDDWFCQCGTDESSAGNFYYTWCQHWYNNDGADHCFKISDYIYLIIFAGFIISFICKSEKVKNIGQTIFAFGVLFLGIETMGDVMKPLAASPVFTAMIAKVSHIPVLGVCVGTLMTLVVQSSSATIAVLQNFAEQAGPDGITSILGLAGAIPILLGDNIGTTITALLASVGQSRDAKRTALAHCMFNVSGSLIFIWFVHPYAKLIQYISPKGAEVDVISRQIANAHTGFNFIMTLFWLPLIWLLVKIVMFIIPGEKDEKDASQPMYLDNNLVNQPTAALRLLIPGG